VCSQAQLRQPVKSASRTMKSTSHVGLDIKVPTTMGTMTDDPVPTLQSPAILDVWLLVFNEMW